MCKIATINVGEENLFNFVVDLLIRNDDIPVAIDQIRLTNVVGLG